MAMRVGGGYFHLRSSGLTRLSCYLEDGQNYRNVVMTLCHGARSYAADVKFCRCLPRGVFDFLPRNLGNVKILI